jgi:hypothetical protein
MSELTSPLASNHVLLYALRIPAPAQPMNLPDIAARGLFGDTLARRSQAAVSSGCSSSEVVCFRAFAGAVELPA